jgi:hypothetical protein
METVLPALLVLALLGPATAQERRLDLFDTTGFRTGYAILDERSGLHAVVDGPAWPR